MAAHWGLVMRFLIFDTTFLTQRFNVIWPSEQSPADGYVLKMEAVK
jgi:hypothetical protein